jgi:hypothetical protein
MAALTFTNASADLLIGSTGNDIFTLSADSGLVATDFAQGMGGADKLLVTGKTSTLDSDALFTGIHNIQELDYAKSTTTVELSNMAAKFAASGIRTIDASAVTGDVVIDIAAVDVKGMTIVGGSGDNSLAGTDHNDLFRIRADTLTAGDTIFGNGHDLPLGTDLRTRTGDVLQLYLDAGIAKITDAQFENVQVDTLALSGKGTISVTLGENAQNANIDLVDARGSTGNVSIDLSARTDRNEILFTSSGLTAGDKLAGALGLTTLDIIGKAVLADAAFTQVSGIRTLDLLSDPTVTDYTGASLVLGAKSQAAGLTRIVNETGKALSVDAGARTDSLTLVGGDAAETLIGSQGQVTFLAGAGDDTLSLKFAGFTQADTFTGGDGTDTLHILDASGKTEISDFSFAGLTSVERLVLDAAGAQTVSLGATAQNAGINTVDATKVTGGLTLKTSSKLIGCDIHLGSGADTLDLSIAQVHVKSTALTAADSIHSAGASGLHFTDAVKLTDAYFAGLKAGISGFSSLLFDNAAKGQSMAAGDGFKAFVDNQQLSSAFVLSAAGDQGFLFDFTKFAGSSTLVDVVGGSGGDTVLLGGKNTVFEGQGGNDTFSGSLAAISLVGVDGGAGAADTLIVTTPATTLVDDDLDTVIGVEILKLVAAKSGTYDITLGGKAASNGFNTVDASAAGVNVKVTGGAAGITVIAGAKDNTLTGSTGDDTFVFDLKTFNAADKVDGLGSGSGGDAVRFSTGGVINTASFAGTAHVERIQFSDAGNTLVLTDALLTISDGLQDILTPNGGALALQVAGGKGNDKIDLSALTDPAKHVQVLAGLGADQLTGSTGNDSFVFAEDGALTGADVVKGGLGYDVLLAQFGNYGPDAFKGLSSIEEIAFTSLSGTGSSANVKLNNDAFKGADLNADGTKELAIHLYAAGSSIDVSAVTALANDIRLNLDYGVDVKFIGGSGDDTVEFTSSMNKTSFTNANFVDGGAGLDTLIVHCKGTSVGLNDSRFESYHNMERLSVDSDTPANFTFGANAQSAGFDEVVIHNAQSIELDVTSAFKRDLTITLDAYRNTRLFLGDGDDVVRSDAADIGLVRLRADGGGGDNTILLYGGGSVADNAFVESYNSGMRNFQHLLLTDGSYSLTLGAAANSSAFATIDATDASNGTVQITLDTGFTRAIDIIGSAGFDVIGSTEAAMTVTGGGGADFLAGGTGNDTFVYVRGSDSFMTSAGDESHMDQVKNFVGSNGTSGDVIDVSALGGHLFTELGTFNTLQEIMAAVQSNIGVGDVDVLSARTATDTYLFVDANHNGQFDFAINGVGSGGDLAIKVVGTTTALLAADPSLVI